MEEKVISLKDCLFQTKYSSALNSIIDSVKTGGNFYENYAKTIYEKFSLDAKIRKMDFEKETLINTLGNLSNLVTDDGNLTSKLIEKAYDSSMESYYATALGGDGAWFMNKNYELANQINERLEESLSGGRELNKQTYLDFQSAKKITENWMYELSMHKAKHMPYEELCKIKHLFGSIIEDKELNSWYKIDKLKERFNKIDFGDDFLLKSYFQNYVKCLVKKEINNVYGLICRKISDKIDFQHFNDIYEDLSKAVISEDFDDKKYYKRMIQLKNLLFLTKTK